MHSTNSVKSRRRPMSSNPPASSSTTASSSATTSSSNSNGQHSSPPEGQQQRSSGGSKKPVASGGATNPIDFVTLFLYHICKKPLLLPIRTRVSIYFVLVAIGSVLFDFFRPPYTFLANRRGFLNVIMVKFGWGWTLLCLAPFSVSAAFIYTAGRRDLIRRHLMRLLVGSAAWYVVTAVYRGVENVVGQCLPQAQHSHRTYRYSCERAGGVWLGFDISGHVFLLILCNLWIAEEVQILRDWSNLGRLLDQVPGGGGEVDANSSTGPATMPRQMQQLSLPEAQRCRQSYQRLNSGVKSLAVALSVLTLVWDLMLVATVLYFHNMPSKFTAMLTAFIVWFVAYRLWFPTSTVLSPGQPGEGPIKFMTQRT